MDEENNTGPFPGMDPPTEFVTAKFFEMSDLLGGATGDKRKEIIRRFAELNRRKYSNLIRSIDRLVPQCNPLQALAHFAFYDQLILRGKGDKSYKPIEQHSLEFFQAYFLTCPVSTLPVRDTDPRVFARLNCVLHALGQSFAMLGIDRDIPEERRAAELIAQVIRLHTQSVRNAGFADQVMSQLRGIFSALDNEYLAREGLRLTGLVDMWERLMKELTRRVNEFIDGLSASLAASDPVERMRDYCRWKGYSAKSHKEMTEFWRRDGSDPDAASRICINDANRSLMSLYIFHVADFVTAFPGSVDEAALFRVLQQWSYPPQGLVGHPRDNLFLDNPVWERPIVQIDERRFYWPMLEIFHSFGLDMLESLVGRHEDLREKYFNKARSNYLPVRVAELMRKAFPMGQVFTGSLWRSKVSGKNGENDVLVLIDKTALVIECKSGRFTDKSRRGHPQRLKKDLQELINDSATQSQNFVDFLRECEGPVELATLRRETHRFDPSKIRRFIRLTVTLDFLGPFVSAMRKLSEANLISSVAVQAPILSLVDLENVFDLLDSPLQKLHYLKRRAELPQRLDMGADELDLLALYLANAFNIGELENMPDQHIRFDWLHTQIEPYFFGRSIGRPVVKPRLKLTKWWQSIVDSVERKQFEGWTLAGLMLLDLANEEQENLEQGSEAARVAFRGGKKHGEVENILVHVPPSWRDEIAIATVVCNTNDRAKRDHHIREALDKIQEHTSAKMAFVICRSPDPDEGSHWATVFCIF